ncbi:MAG: DHH family phosphoesterase [Candidatus Omnitrophica bacterium]|nr:DHH family phosphoesterase [Candidatus Omnitrophota bacterium]
MKRRPKIIERIIAELRGSQNLCVVGHGRPDGDCIGSQMGLTLALLNQGKSMTCWNEDALPQKLAFLDPNHLIQPPRPGMAFDCVIALDVASMERLGRTAEHIQNRKLFINIDHHQSNTRYADINWVSSRTPSTGELIYRLLKEANWPISPQIADCLFTAVSTDTGSFQYPSTRPSTYYVAGELVKRGAHLATICQEVYQSFPLSRVRLLQHVFNHFHLTNNNRIGYFWLRPADFVRTGTNVSDSEGLIDHIRAIEPVEVACLFEELEPNVIRVSLRSKNTHVNVNEIAKQFGGGGHNAAAGARITGGPLAVQRRVIAAIREALPANVLDRHASL